MNLNAESLFKGTDANQNLFKGLKDTSKLDTGTY